jgi:hypothetical protein
LSKRIIRERPRVRTMPKKGKVRASGATKEEVLDSYERWLEMQPVRHAKARAGFSSREEIA